jgi:lipopolysaccharide/colanic/teichoic acid biosynthesis glycosyltransferase
VTIQIRAGLDGLPAGIAPGIAPGLRQEARGRRGGLYRNGLKRLLDVVIVLIAAPAVLTVVIALALCVATDRCWPFYVQERLGRNGRVFRMWKLRTMVPDADRVLAAHLAADPAARAEWDRYQKLRRDPRVTAFGTLLRRTSLDELPQLFNVLRGDMSLVGPRPMMPSQRDIYPGTEYYLLRPGITGPWQTSERNETSFAQRAEFDRRYFEELSLGTDLRLLLRTVKVVLQATGV